jgi:Restriction endonuclease BglII
LCTGSVVTMTASTPPNLSALIDRGFQIEFKSHAQAILSVDFPEVLTDLEAALADLSIPIEEIIAGGGGEAKGTQRLRKALNQLKWVKTKFEIKKTINGREQESISHEIDHVKGFSSGTIALEIEWNNKDPFLDRDLENFKRLHADGAISVGIIVTRGRSLQEQMGILVRRFIDERKVGSFSELMPWGYEPTAKQRSAIETRINRKKNPLTFSEAFVDKFVSDKFGEATTHWRKLEDRIHRGVGNPCPLALIGLPANIVTFHEGEAALREILGDEDSAGDLFDR